MKRLVRAAALGVCLLLLTRADMCTNIEQAQSSITVIVDLSKSWHNEQSTEQNKRLLSQVMTAIVAMTDKAAEDPKNLPVMIRVLAIGDMSLNRPPLCETAFAPRLIGSAAGTVSTRKKLALFLEDCTASVLTRPQEMMTDITGALDSVSRAVAHQRGSYKAVILLSDMKEERRAGQTGTFGSLNGVHVLMLYRTLLEDQRDTKAFNTRIDGWGNKLKDAGATVSIDSDSFANSDSIERVFQ